MHFLPWGQSRCEGLDVVASWLACCWKYCNTGSAATSVHSRRAFMLEEHKKRAVGIFWVQEEERERLRRTLKAGLLLFFWSLISCSSNKMTPNSMSGAHARARTHTHTHSSQWKLRGARHGEVDSRLLVNKIVRFYGTRSYVICSLGPCLLPVEFSQHPNSLRYILILSCNWDVSTKFCKHISSPPPRMLHLALISYLLI